MFQASFEKLTLEFKSPAGTSRGILRTKNSWIIKLWKTEFPSQIGVGEASVIEGLSPDWNEEYVSFLEHTINSVDAHIQTNFQQLKDYPSIRFALESALINLKVKSDSIYYPSEFTQGDHSIHINGLIWMGDKEYMAEQIQQKLDAGYSCIKLKIGAIDFEAELALLKYIRAKFSKEVIELRVDANGAFLASNALEKLDQLAKYNLHSIEQPIQQGQWKEMAELCNNTPLPIALDEELIGIKEIDTKILMLSTIKPQYIILKPSLIGGFSSCNEWIEIAESYNSGWWITSALESNIGLNAIAQYTFTKNSPMPQGLGTGQLFTNNVESPLILEGDQLFFRKK